MTKKLIVLAAALLVAMPITASTSFGRGGAIQIGDGGTLTSTGAVDFGDGALIAGEGSFSGATIQNADVHVSAATIDSAMALSSGNTLILDRNTALNAAVSFSASGVIDGEDKQLTLGTSAAISAADGTTVTIRNVTIDAVSTLDSLAGFLNTNVSGAFALDNVSISAGYNAGTEFDAVYYDNVTLSSVTCNERLGRSVITFAVTDASRPAVIRLERNLALTAVWTIADGITFDLAGYELDLTGVDNALSFPSAAAILTVKNGFVVLDDASLLFSTIAGNSSIDLYNVDLVATKNTEFTHGQINVYTDSVIHFGEASADTGAEVTVSNVTYTGQALYDAGGFQVFAGGPLYETGMEVFDGSGNNTGYAGGELYADVEQMTQVLGGVNSVVYDFDGRAIFTLGSAVYGAESAIVMHDSANFRYDDYGLTTPGSLQHNGSAVTTVSASSANSGLKYADSNSYGRYSDFRGPQGETGATGAQGVQGVAGADGQDGLYDGETISTTGTQDVTNAGYALVSDMFLRNDGAGNSRLITCASTDGTLDGNGHVLHFASNATDVVSVSDLRTLTVTDVKLANYAGQITTNSTGTFNYGAATVVEFGGDVSSEIFNVTGAGVVLDLQGHTITAPEFVVDNAATLTVRNGRIVPAANQDTNALIQTVTTEVATVTFEDVEFVTGGITTGNLTFGANSPGSMDDLTVNFSGNCIFTGGNTVVFAPDAADIGTARTINVSDHGVLTFDRTDVTIGSSDAGTDKALTLASTATVEFIGATINVNGVDATINTGTVVVDHTSTIAFAGATPTLNLGDAAAAINLVVMPGALLKTTGSGTLSIDTTA